MSVWVTLEMHVKEGQYDTLEVFLSEKLPAVRGFEGALGVTLYFDQDTNTLLIVEEWKSQDHHAAYIAAITANDVLNQLAAFMKAPPAIKYYSRLAL
ncbi:MAG: hypothetical protein GY767_01445 [Shimia sp.]|nr:hypothetical protein [Shimia sp.]